MGKVMMMMCRSWRLLPPPLMWPWCPCNHHTTTRHNDNIITHKVQAWHVSTAGVFTFLPPPLLSPSALHDTHTPAHDCVAVVGCAHHDHGRVCPQLLLPIYRVYPPIILQRSSGSRPPCTYTHTHMACELHSYTAAPGTAAATPSTPRAATAPTHAPCADQSIHGGLT